MNLSQEIAEKKKEIFTDGYPMSIGELMSLYKDGELDIHPEFQRFFRWSILQKSKLIESIVLGIPIPSIFISQRDNGVWDVVDGQQRLSTIFEFAGILKDENDKLLKASTLVKTSYLAALEGIMWENEVDPSKSFDSSLRLAFKREKIDIKIVKKESDENVKFELFQRLNTLGSKLSDQEVRNCLLVMINDQFYKWLKKLSLDVNFLSTISLTERLIEEQYNMELVLRFFILKNLNLDEIRSTSDLGEFITNKMIEMASDKNYPYEAEEYAFRNTFKLLNFTLESESFKRYNSSKARFEGSFLLSAFEAIGIGLGKNISLWSDIERDDKLKGDFMIKTKELWNDAQYKEKSGSGVNVTRRVPTIIPVGQRIFRP
jgi:uncharacterized protein with ParB-like and HNH nuclease domain